jgi:sugar phosphate isomerase/epimerase
MDRRRFIKQSSVIGAIIALPTSLACFSNIQPSNYKMGYQLYSIHNEMAKNPIATLKALKAMGYEHFETFGFDNNKNMFYGYKSSEFKHILDDLSLSVSSGHYGFSSYLDKSDDELKRFVDQCIIGATAIGSKYITWPWIAPEQRTIENFKRMTHKLNLAGEQITRAGLGFAYHNHGFEFEDHNGENGFDIILSETDPALVKLQMDMYWVMHSSKYTPKALIKNQPGRYVMWHIKDMDKISRDYTEMGNGSIDYMNLMPDPAASGLEYYFIEQGGNFSINTLASAEQSATYFKKHLKKLI